MSLDLLECPIDCDSPLEPADFNECAPDLLDGEIAYVLVAKGDQPFANINDPDEHNSRVDNTSTADNAVRRLLGIGSFVGELGQERAIPGGRFDFAKNTYTLDFDIYDNNDTNYNFVRSLACGATYLVWLVQSNGIILGGNDGLLIRLTSVPNIQKGRDTQWILNIQGKYTSKRMPLRDDYVMATGDANLQ